MSLMKNSQSVEACMARWDLITIISCTGNHVQPTDHISFVHIGKLQSLIEWISTLYTPDWCMHELNLVESERSNH